jgi:hypothetical protein
VVLADVERHGRLRSVRVHEHDQHRAADGPHRARRSRSACFRRRGESCAKAGSRRVAVPKRHGRVRSAEGRVTEEGEVDIGNRCHSSSSTNVPSASPQGRAAGT